MGVLKLRAINLDHCAGLAKENLGGRFHHRVFPEPVGPRNKRFPTGRPGEFNPARKDLVQVHQRMDALSCPTIFDRSAVWKSTVSVLRLLGSSGRISASSRLRMAIELSFMTVS